MKKMNNEKNDTPDKPKPKSSLKKRGLKVIVIALSIVIAIYTTMRFIYPVWINASLPDNAPRIGFSLDNTLLGQLGITDATYQRVVTKAGGKLITLRPDAAGEHKIDPQTLKSLLDQMQLDGILLTGGGDVDPEVYGGLPNKTNRVHRLRDDFEIALIHEARQRGLPVLGICRGCQIINVAFGGTIRNLRKEKDVGKKHFVISGHPVDIAGDSNLAKTMGTRHIKKVISLHGQAADKIGDGVRISATGPGNIVEAIEADSAGKEGWIVGIQWHPELAVGDQAQFSIFKTLVDRARKVTGEKP